MQVIRGISRDFISGRITFDEFWPQFKRQLGAHFDPLDQAIADLTQVEKDEVLFYFSLDGGEFGETESLLPRDPNWNYGSDQTPYGWVDKKAFRRMYADEFKKRMEAQDGGHVR